ncbi:MAG: thiamine pyrophosphate-dependent enzyme, partial [Candidatus Binataceae bacterium]
MKTDKQDFAEKSESYARAITAERTIELYRAMMLVRRFDERAAEPGFAEPAHASLYRGEEATCAGTILALNRGDYLVSAYREHGHRIAAGADAKIAMAYRRGRIPSDAIADFDAELHFAGGATVSSHALAI